MPFNSGNLEILRSVKVGWLAVNSFGRVKMRLLTEQN